MHFIWILEGGPKIFNGPYSNGWFLLYVRFAFFEFDYSLVQGLFCSLVMFFERISWFLHVAVAKLTFCWNGACLMIRAFSAPITFGFWTLWIVCAFVLRAVDALYLLSWNGTFFTWMVTRTFDAHKVWRAKVRWVPVGLTAKTLFRPDCFYTPWPSLGSPWCDWVRRSSETVYFKKYHIWRSIVAVWSWNHAGTCRLKALTELIFLHVFRVRVRWQVLQDLFPVYFNYAKCSNCLLVFHTETFALVLSKKFLNWSIVVNRRRCNFH